MKIQNDPLRALLEQDEARKNSAGTEGFEALLHKELQRGQGEGGTGPVSTAGQASAVLALQIRAAQELGGVKEPDEAASDAFMGRLDGLLDKWENYAASLNNPSGASLKSLHALLGDLGGDLDGLKAALPGLSGGMEELGGLVNELEVLEATERFKLNRGDYQL
ncbi:MAG: hypothetical protein LBD82_05160 [Deltaproteobacteria bacterium]|jgi:hypothetical protein|nr:hypothetical protein [Deltaproteobacteria bacterium]